MKFKIEKRAWGGYSVWLILKKWRPWYGHINERFAVANHWLEFGIIDQEFAGRFRRWNQNAK